MKQKNNKLKFQRKKDLKIMVDSFMRSMTSAPSFDLRRDYPGRFDRKRSTGGVKPLDA
jgi:hypothetical protein